jgi:CrcB protein
MLKLIYIGTGGFLGAISRYLISKWVESRWESILPYGTLAVNIIGSFFLGFLMTIFLERGITQPELRVGITTGFLGALTTFSTFGYETVMLLGEKDFLLASINVLTNLLLGLTAVIIGIILARAI